MTSSAGRPRYKAFISYSHAADGKLAPALEVGLERFAKPWYQLRAFHVFRDTTGLSATPELWGSIQHALESSEYFVLLASPAAAQSKWVQREVEFWLLHRSVDKLLIVLTDGVIAWDANANDFDWSRTDALPRLLERRASAEPNYIDLRWARVDTDLSLRRPRFLDAVAGLAATLRQVPLDDLIGEDVGHHRTTRRLLQAGVALLLALTTFAFYTAYLATRASKMAEGLNTERERTIEAERKAAKAAEAEAESQRRSLVERAQSAASSRQVAAAATGVLARDRELSTLLAMEAVRMSPTPEADRALRAALARPVPPVIFRGPESPVTSVALGPNSQRLLAGFVDGSARIWTMASPVTAPVVLAAKAVAYEGADAVRMSFSPDASTVLTVPYRSLRTYLEPEGKPAAARLWDAATGRLRLELKHPYVQHAAFSPDGRRVVTVGDDRRVVMWDAESGARLAELQDHERGIVHVEFSSNGRWFATSAKDDTVRIRDASDGKPVTILRVPGKTFLSAASFSPDGRWVLTMNEKEPPRLWDWQRTPGGSVAELTEQMGPVYSASFASDSKLLVTAGHGNTARVWEVATGRSVYLLEHEDSVTDTLFDPSGRWILSVSLDGSAVLWDAATGTRVLDFGGYDGLRTAAAFGQPEPRVATGTAEGKVLLYDCEICGTTSELEMLARSRVTRPLTAEERKQYLGAPGQ